MASELAHEFLEIMTKTEELVEPYNHDLTIKRMNPVDHAAYALLCVADAIRDAFYYLGTADASTRMGALEMVAGELKEMGMAITTIASAIEDHE